MTGSSRWADDEADKDARRQEKEEKKRAKLAKQQQQEAEAQRKATLDAQENARPAKRRRLSNDEQEHTSEGTGEKDDGPTPLLRIRGGGWGPARHIDNFERLNHIEEGSYGWVSRAKEITTGEIVALKKLKMDSKSEEGFPVTALREIQALKASRHRHIVELKEVAMGDSPDEVFLVMEFLEHDLKTLQEEMAEPFLPSEIKTLMLQIVAGVDYLHDNWILHRDLKTSNILLNNRGQIKLADFGMARQFSDPPPPNLTQLVVTLWYRAPELLLGTAKYDTAIDLWSIGCIFGELVSKEPLLQGKNEADQLSKIFSLVGTPSEEIWPGFRRLPNAKVLRFPSNSSNAGGSLRVQFPLLASAGAQLLAQLLSLNPADRPTAAEVLSHPYFSEPPRPKTTAMFPTFPSKAGGERKRRFASPNAPKRGEAPRINGEEFSGLFAARENEAVGGGFALRLV
jgi:cell division cycle 2-like protein